MTRLVLDVPNKNDLDLLLPLLKRLKIRFSSTEYPIQDASEIEEALRIIRLGCDMNSFGDALQFQIETRKEQIHPMRD
jgi:hypothetical protein